MSVILNPGVLEVPSFEPAHVVHLDFETYYDEKYNLDRCTTSDYVTDPRFEVLGVGLKVDDAETVWMEESEFREWAATWDWDTTAACAHHCLPGDVEVLTRAGWKRISEATVDQEIMQWSPQTNRLSWVKPSHKTESKSTAMVKWDTNHHRCRYTPEHRMYFATPDVPAWRAETAGQVAAKSPNNVYIPLAGIFSAAEDLLLTPDEARLMEAVRADGTWTRSSGPRFHLSKKRKIDRLFALAAKVDTVVTERPSSNARRFSLSLSPAVQKIIALLGPRKQYEIEWVLDLSVECRAAILDEARHWDGSLKKSDSTGRVIERSYVWSCARKETVEAFQLMAHATGWAFSGAWRDNQRGKSAHIDGCELYVATVSEKARAKLVEKAETEVLSEPESVFCFTVPTGAFLVRSNDRVFVTGNCHFDGFILSHHYKVAPSFWFDTLSMSKALDLPGGLAELGPHFGVGEKGDELLSSKGKHRKDFTEEEWATFGLYCINDVDLMRGILSAMTENFPESELWVIDMTIRLFTEPQLVVDEPQLREFVEEEKVRKAELLARVGMTKKGVGSNAALAQAFAVLGVEAPTKTSPTNGTTIYAFAKTDPGMQELLEHEDEDVRALAEARIAVKSGQTESRGERYMRMGAGGRPLPVYLVYCGAHTKRWTASDKTQFQNLEKTNKKNPKKGMIKKSLCAIPGRKVVAADSGAIEARGTSWLAGHETLTAGFRENRDIYSEFASDIYNRRVDRKKNPEDEIPGFVAKICVLGLGYGMGWKRLASTLLAGAMGGPPVRLTETDANTIGVDLDKFFTDEKKVAKVQRMISRLSIEDLATHCAVAEGLVKRYRKINQPVAELWKMMDRVLEVMLEIGDNEQVSCGTNDCLTVIRNGIILPNGLVLHYPELRKSKRIDEEGEETWGSNFSYRARYKRQHLYGALLLENVIQAMSRIVVSEQLLSVRAKYGYEPILLTHDEIVIIVEEDQAQIAKHRLIEEMKVTPKWAAGWPLNAEGGTGQTYGACK